MPERVVLKPPAACVLVIYGIYTGGYMTPVITVINTIANLLSCMEKRTQQQLACWTSGISKGSLLTIPRSPLPPPPPSPYCLRLQCVHSSKGLVSKNPHEMQVWCLIGVFQPHGALKCQHIERVGQISGRGVSALSWTGLYFSKSRLCQLGILYNQKGIRRHSGEGGFE